MEVRKGLAGCESFSFRPQGQRSRRSLPTQPSDLSRSAGPCSCCQTRVVGQFDMVESRPMGDAPGVDLREFASFAIEIDFVRGSGDPSRPFRTMVDLIEAFGRFDRDLIKGVDATIEPVLILENVEAGSIKSWLITVLRQADDEALKSGDWKRILGSYAVKGKYAVLKALEGAASVTDDQLLARIQTSLALEAQQTQVSSLQGYAPMSRTRLAAHIADITSSLQYLGVKFQ